VRRLYALLGDEIDRELHAALTTVALGFCGVYAFVAFFAVWAVEELAMPREQVGVAFAAAALAGVCGALAGGRLSDRVGRRPVVVAAAAAQTCVAAFLLLPLGRAGAVAVLVAMSFLQPLRGATQRALAADLARPGRLESAFASLRVAVNLGASGGPLIGAALVLAGWTALHVGIVAVFALSLAAALRLPTSPPQPRPAGARPGFGALLRDRATVAVLLAGVLAWAAYQAFETVLPVVLTGDHGLEPAVWGLLFALNPLLTVALQLRVTRWTAPLRADVRLAVALALIGLPFLLLNATAAVPMVALVVLAVTAGELLWAPAAEALVVRLAPAGARGSALGAAAAANWVGTAVGPACAFAVGGAWGEPALWAFVAATAIASGALYVAACREPRLAARTAVEPA
jgi:predicted MFS family arabinose efflux permease